MTPALKTIFGMLAGLSCALVVWQWIVARRFRLHARIRDKSFAPPVTCLKPLKGCDAETEGCLRSWFEQEYDGPLQILFGVASPEDPVCDVVRRLIEAFPKVNARLVICKRDLGPNAKVSTLVQLQSLASHDTVVISDADVRIPSDLLGNLVRPLRDNKVGLVNCFYKLANPTTPAMRWEAVAINSDFWSQVLQAQSLKPLDFALGAVMATRRNQLERIGGFEGLLEYLADDYKLGHTIVDHGDQIVICPVVVECWSEATGWKSVWSHQLRWSRTIRVCQPLPFFFSILSNGALWPLLWIISTPTRFTTVTAFCFWCVRIVTARSNQRRLSGYQPPWFESWLVLWKDLAGSVIWALAFIGNRIEWRGYRYRMLADGRLKRI